MAEEKADMNGLRNPDFWKDYHQNVQSQIEKINSLLADLRTSSADSNPATQFADEVSLPTPSARRWKCSRNNLPREKSRLKIKSPIRFRVARGQIEILPAV
jgi:hypothetical protein